MNRILPPGPREYWNELAAEHKDVPEHQQWMYSADPFAAAKVVQERQEKAAQRREEPSEAGQKPQASNSGASREYVNAPEVKMASSLRDLVEEAIKQVRHL